MKQIAALLGVSPASVHAWTRDIEITAEQRARNLRQAGAARAQKWIELNREKRRTYQREGRAQARRAEPLHQAGCMLYWAEGSKDRNRVKFCNSDPHMLALFMRFLTECLEIQPHRLTLSLHVYLGNGLSIAEIEAHWLTTLDLPRECLRKHRINPLPTSSSGMKRHKLPYGVAMLTLASTEVTQHIFGAIQEYGGFEEPRWLDGPPRRSQAQG